MSTGSRMARAARAYAGYNLRVFPCTPNGKLPLTAHGYQDATADAAQIDAWWSKWPSANVAMACAPSGYMVLDVDSHRLDDAGRAFVADLGANHPTSTQDTPTGGTHYMYMLPHGVALSNSAGQLPAGIDVRVNGYVLLSPSVVTYRGDEAAAKGVADGHTGRYQWRTDMRPNEFPPQPLPEHVMGLLLTKRPESPAASIAPPTSDVSSERAFRYAEAALERELDALARAPQGGRNEQLNKSAFSLGQLAAGGALNGHEIADKLSAVSQAIGLDAREIERTIRSGMQAGAKKPRGVPPPTHVSYASDAAAVDNAADAPAGEAKAKRGRPPKLGMATLYSDAIAGLGYSFKLNLATERVEHSDGTVFHDGEQAVLFGEMIDLGFNSRPLILDMVLADAWGNRYDPIHDFFNGLTWDGEDHISKLSYYFTDKHPPITYPDGRTSTVFGAWLRHWLIGAAGKAFSPIQNPMLVLAAEQGVGKSEFAKWLCSPLPKYFVESSINPESVDHQRWASGNLLWEVGELGATTRKADIEALKAFITRHEHTYRVPYARNEVQKPARASFIGTVNPDNAGFFVDATGNRRFLTVELTAIHWQGYLEAIDIRQVWAQAYALYRENNDAWKLGNVETARRDVINVEFDVDDPVRDAIVTRLDLTPSDDTDTPSLPFMSSLEITTLLSADVRVHSTRGLQMDIGRAMKKLGIAKGKRNNVNGYFGVTRRFASNLSP